VSERASVTAVTAAAASSAATTSTVAAAGTAVAGLLGAGLGAFAPVFAAGQQQAKGHGAQEYSSRRHRPYSRLMGYGNAYSGAGISFPRLTIS
jgi:hypothetical protein